MTENKTEKKKTPKNDSNNKNDIKNGVWMKTTKSTINDLKVIEDNNTETRTKIKQHKFRDDTQKRQFLMKTTEMLETT